MQRAQPNQASLLHGHRNNFKAAPVDCPVCGVRRVLRRVVLRPIAAPMPSGSGTQALDGCHHLLMMPPALFHHLRRGFQVELRERERHAVVEMLYRIPLQIACDKGGQRCNVARNAPDGVLRRM